MTIAVVSVFIGVLFQVFLAVEAQRLVMQKRDDATHLALSNLAKITNMSQVPSGNGTDASGTSVSYQCDATAGKNDLTRHMAATGADLIAGSVVKGEDLAALGNGATQTLRITYPRGCANGMPARIQATITYGTNPVETVVHAGYVN